MRDYAINVSLSYGFGTVPALIENLLKHFISIAYCEAKLMFYHRLFPTTGGRRYWFSIPFIKKVHYLYFLFVEHL